MGLAISNTNTNRSCNRYLFGDSRFKRIMKIMKIYEDEDFDKDDVHEDVYHDGDVEHDHDTS